MMLYAKSPFIVIITWLTAMFWLFFPGYMSTDSYVQLMQGRRLHYSDGHPVIMARLWGFLDSIVAGPFLMLFLQLTLFIFGLYLLIKVYLRSPPIQAIALFVIAFNPAVFSITGIIWKDVWTVSFFLWGMYFLSSSIINGEMKIYYKIFLGFFCLSLGSLFRSNAIGGSLATVAVFLIYFLVSGNNIPGKRIILIPTTLLVLPISFFLMKLSLESNINLEKRHQETVIMAFDLVGMSVISDKRLIDYGYTEFIDDTTSVRDLKKCFNPHNVSSVYKNCPEDEPILARIRSSHDLDKIHKNWFYSVMTDPVVWLKHKLKLAKRILNITHPGVSAPILRTPYEGKAKKLPKPHDSDKRNDARTLITKYSQLTHKAVLYFTAAFFLSAFTLISIFRSKNFSNQMFGLFSLLVTGLTYQLTIFLGAVARDYRYSHLMILFTFSVFTILTMHFLNQYILDRRKLISSAP